MELPAANPKATDFIALMSDSASNIASLIDHTLLRADATRPDILQLCREAREYKFASVCVNAYWVPVAAAELAGSPVLVCTVVGFPLGATSTEAKVAETEAAIAAGAREVDMVENIGALRSGDRQAVQQDIEARKIRVPGNDRLRLLVL